MYCDHKNIVAAHYGFHVKGEIGDRLACEIRCADCDKVLFTSYEKGVQLAHDYIERNKDYFDTLVDLTCDNLNEKYNILNGLLNINNHDDKLVPMSGKIKITYILKEHPKYGEKASYHRTYEDFGEWLCRQFDKINIINITDK